ncbi:MAG: cupin domain-containing protein [Burkholderiales bacterium]|nr:cupin domain-containing protein [Burkholderiales bacterium]
MRSTLLGGLAPAAFLSRYWQRRPLLVRGAVPGFRDLVSVTELFRIASSPDAESRVVRRDGRRWQLAQGPFATAELRCMPGRRWTLLVQGVNHFAPRVDRLMRRFAFLPYARLDDVMVSYAAPGGGVGPHVDSYDVFLVQGLGRRRWRFAPPGRHRLDPRAPLEIIADFTPATEWIAGPGDLIYLPPGWVHEGAALEPCLTYSIGFRAPSAQELAVAYLQFLEDHIERAGRYRDPGLAPQRSPARLGDDLIARAVRLLKGLPGTRAVQTRFLGRYLSEPKPHVTFRKPARALGARAFARAIARRGVRLAPATIVLYRGRTLYVNGEEAPIGAAGSALRRLANRRVLAPPVRIPPKTVALLRAWYLSGYLLVGVRARERDGLDIDGGSDG